MAVACLVPSVTACSGGNDGSEAREDAPSWVVTNTSTANDAQAIVDGQTGIQYIGILKNKEGSHRYGMCERYGVDGHVMRDGDATNGGAFGLIEVSSDDGTTVYRDNQTGIAYAWHSWQSENAYAGQGLVVCRDRDGNVMRWDDDELRPVTPADGNGEDADSQARTGDRAGEANGDETPYADRNG